MKLTRLSLLLSRLPSIAPLLLFILAPIPLFYLLFLTHVQLKNLNATETKINHLHRQFRLAKLQKENENRYLNKLNESSPYFINEHLESIDFLKKERESATVSDSAQTIPPQNLRFVEGKIRRNKTIQEVEENQERAVLMNEEDLKKTLALIEGVTIPPYHPILNAPQLIIRSIDLRKTTLSAYSNAFEVTMHLIKREGLR